MSNLCGGTNSILFYLGHYLIRISFIIFIIALIIKIGGYLF
jgi:hypothetical protein